MHPEKWAIAEKRDKKGVQYAQGLTVAKQLALHVADPNLMSGTTYGPEYHKE